MKAFEGRLSLQGLYGEDRFMETAFFLMILAAALLLASAAGRTPRGHLRSSYTIAAAIVLIIALEEISYGQRIFGWNTPEFLQKSNIQGETNLHNLLNYQFETLYPLMALVIIPVLISIFLNLQPQKYTLLEIILPHPGLLFSSMVIAFLSIVTGFNQQELLEELFAVLFLVYAIRAWLLSDSLQQTHNTDQISSHKGIDSYY
ncbi:MAG: hypothetical protein JXA25_00885 [Anaerolineales bacterium]|nr:hypothetical protein [Anaerolineales bacterium]